MSFLYVSANGRCVRAKIDEPARQCTASFGVRQSSHIGARAFLTMVLTMRPPLRRAAADSRWPGPFAPLHTSHVRCLRSFSLLLSSLALRGFLVSRVKFTNPYGAPRASNESSLSLSPTVFRVLFSSYSRSLCLFYSLFISILFVLIFFSFTFKRQCHDKFAFS